MSNCPHDFQLYGEKLGDNAWFCYGCCGIITWSGLANSMVLVEPQPERLEECREGIQIIIDAFAKYDTPPPPLVKP